MVNFSSVKSVKTVWVHDGRAWVYNALADSIRGNDDSRSLRFQLHEVDGQDDDLEVVIQKKTDDSYIFKTDYYKDPEYEYGLKAFAGDGESVLQGDTKDGIVYFHLSV